MILMREVVLKKSSNPKKKYDAYVQGKKVSFGATVLLQATLISPNIKTQKEDRDTSPDTKQMKTGMI